MSILRGKWAGTQLTPYVQRVRQWPTDQVSAGGMEVTKRTVIHGTVMVSSLKESAPRRKAAQSPCSRLYTTKIIKAGALLSDTKTLLAHRDQSQPVSENLQRFRADNIFGKASRSRAEDILAISFEYLERAVSILSHPSAPMHCVEPRKVLLTDSRKFPTLRMSYGDVPYPIGRRA